MSVELQVGFVPLVDCATLVVAAEQGFARAEGLELRLVREASWANIRDRVIVGQFAAAQMLGPMAVSASLGLGHLRVPMSAPIALGLGGNAICLSTAMWRAFEDGGVLPGAGAGDLGAALKRLVAARAERGSAPVTLASVYPFSCHSYELRYWLAASGIDPDRDVRLVVLPPPYMVDALRAGEIDGFCAGEPWSSLAVEAGNGVLALPGSAIWRLAPEKVLGLREDWVNRHPDEVEALVRAVHRAALWCDDAAHHADLAQLLSDRRYVGAPAEVIARALGGRLLFERGGATLDASDFLVFARHFATFPWKSHAQWFAVQMARWGQLALDAAELAAARAVYRPDLYRHALASRDVAVPLADDKAELPDAAPRMIPSSQGPRAYGPDGFFDGIGFDPAAARA